MKRSEAEAVAIGEEGERRAKEEAARREVAEAEVAQEAAEVLERRREEEAEVEAAVRAAAAVELAKREAAAVVVGRNVKRWLDTPGREQRYRDPSTLGTKQIM